MKRHFPFAIAALLALAPPSGAAWSLEDFRDPGDGRFDASRFLLDLDGFLPVPIIVTEPAVGFGGGAALVFFKRNPVPLGYAPTRKTPPDITVAAGFATENGSRGGGVGHLGFTSDGRWRYAAGVGRASVNLAFFGEPVLPGSPASEGVDLNLEASFAIADARRRLGETNWSAGLRYVRADIASRLAGGGPGRVPERDADTTLGGLAAIVEYDGRDNIFTPNSGSRLTLYAYDFGKAFGGEASFRLLRLSANTYVAPARDVIVGGRFDYRSASGDPPFYARPFIELRGIPVMRYQGDRVAVAELEARWNLDGRWSLVGFAGAGRATSDGPGAESGKTHGTVGTGFRYLFARELGIHAGVDVARGPEKGAIYLIVGSAWR